MVSKNTTVYLLFLLNGSLDLILCQIAHRSLLKRVEKGRGLVLRTLLFLPLCLLQRQVRVAARR